MLALKVDMKKLDNKDLQILELLQEDCTISLQSLAEKVGLTQTPCYERVKKLRELGVIERYSAILRSSLLGYKHQAVLRVRVADEASNESVSIFESSVVANKAVVQVLRISSKFNYVINFRYKEIEDFFRFVEIMNKEEVVIDSEVVMVLETLKDDQRVFF